LYFEPPKPEEQALNKLDEDDERELRQLRQRQAERAAVAAAEGEQPGYSSITSRGAGPATTVGVARPMTPMETKRKPLTAAERLQEEARERREMQEEMDRYDREMMEEEAR
jgi:hypothetical protein